MKIFVTGIAGFIGFHLARALRQRGNIVLGCDNFNNYYDPQIKRDRVALLAKEGISVVDADIRHLTPLEPDITHFVHLAAQAGVRYSIKHPQAYVQSNLDGFVQVLEAVRPHPHLKLIYASSSSVYGLNTKTPFAETDPTDLPASLYGATKKSNELIAHSYHHMFGMHVTGLRFFTVYGPWGRPDMAYFSFTNAISKGKPIQLYNQGQMKRDFTYVDDITAGIMAAIDLGAPLEIFNLGNSQPEDVLSLVKIIEDLTGKKANIELLPVQAGEVPVTFADITKSHKILKFSPKISLQEGMEKFYDWYRTYYNIR